jgi:hypothetical protein
VTALGHPRDGYGPAYGARYRIDIRNVSNHRDEAGTGIGGGKYFRFHDPVSSRCFSADHF